MSTVTTKDGTQIYDKDWGSGPPDMLSNGWPLSAGAWDDQMLFLAARGFRCIAHDRRGHGRSSQPWSGNEMDTYADDLAALAGALDLKGAVHVGHSTGGGEVARYLGRHGTKRAAKAVLIGAVTEDLAKIDVPTLILHGDDDQIVPIQASALKSSKIVTTSTLKIYPGAPHGLTGAHEQEFNKDLLDFITS